VVERNVKIIGVDIYHPENKITNEYYIEHFRKLGIEVEGLLNHLGRSERFQIEKDSDESSLSMAVKASLKALDNAKITADMLDIIVFVSDYPEYLMPSNSLIIHNKLKAVNANTIFDMNGNCIGMITAFDQVSRYMKGNNQMKYALITGAIMPSKFAREDDAVFYPTVGDGASAVVLECSEEDIERGFIDCCYKADSSLCQNILFPACGMSKILDESISNYDKKVQWIPHDVSYFSDEWLKLILTVLNRNNTKLDDINHFLFSQFSKADILATMDKLGLGYDKFTFIADKYGYMGCSSPIFALYDAMKKNKIQKGDKVIFCSVGSGYSMAAVLYQF
jgi:3-oxoacyl-[acyl-carrier-protein] synthase III